MEIYCGALNVKLFRNRVQWQDFVLEVLIIQVLGFITRMLVKLFNDILYFMNVV